MAHKKAREVTVAIRLTEAVDAELERLVARLPATSKSGLARVLLERALRELGGDVMKLIEQPGKAGTQDASRAL